MVVVQNVSKVYHLYRRPSDRVLEILPFVRRPLHADFHALRNVNLRVDRGETLGIVGPNGSGKSTLLQVICGILKPTSGRVLTDGRIAALLELGAGFNPEFTGRENVYLSGEILGLTRKQVERAFPLISAFAEIGEYMERPVKEYSSGMYVRLAFATAIHVDPEILVVDEALAVGDAIFANRCVQKFEELKRRNVTVLFVSHDLGLVKRLSHRAILMLKGSILAEGSPRDVVNRYVGLVHERQRTEPLLDPGAEPSLPCSFRHGDGASRIVDVQVLDGLGRPTRSIASGETVTVRLRARFNQDVERPVVGMLIRTRLGIDVYGTNTKLEQRELGGFQRGDLLELDFRFDCRLNRNEYTLTVATQHPDGASQDWLDDVLSFSVHDPREAAGVVDLRTHVEWRRVVT